MDILPRWSDLQVGDTISFVGQSIVLDNRGDHLFRAADASRQQLVVRGTIPDSVNVCTFLDLQVIQVVPTIIGCMKPNTKIWPCPPCHVSDLHRLTELCCGMGAFSSTGPLVGFEVLLGIDENPKWQNLFSNIHHDSAAYLTGDIGDSAIIDDALSSGAMHSTILAGISCQPHSTGGDMGGMRDARSTTLHKALKMSWLVQSPMLILECVPGVMTNGEFQRVLMEFCSMTGACLTQQIVKLSNIWCARRDRWFACVSSGVLGPIQIPDLPLGSSYDSIEKIMPTIKSWPQTDMDQIVLTLYELSKFHDFVKGGIANSFLQPTGKLPTSLHSAGNQLYPCKCGCRQGLSLNRLQERGLYGVLLPMDLYINHDGTRLQQCRYLHPCEMFLLNGGLPSLKCDPDLRLTMAAIGQFVSPIQSVWVLSHIAKHVSTFLNQQALCPTTVLSQYIEKVLAARDEMWGIETPHVSPPGEMKHFDLPDSEGNHVQFVASTTTTVQEFLQAETALQNCEVSCEAWQKNFVGDIQPDTCLMQLEKVKEPERIVRSPPLLDESDVVQQGKVVLSPTVPFAIDEDRSQSTIPALLNLKGNDFLSLVAPMVDTILGVQSMTEQLIPKNSRIEVLQNQGSIWADDEIGFALDRIAYAGPSEQGIVVWNPLMISTVVRIGKFQIIRELVAQLPTNATVITAFVVEKHWHPMIWRFDETGVYAYTCGLVHAFSLAHQALQKELCKIRGVPNTPVHNRPLPFIVNEKCGAMAVAYIRHLVHGHPMPNNAHELVQVHEQLRKEFCSACQDVTPRPWLWANGQDECKSKLASLLQHHGVLQSDAAQRAQLVIDKLGISVVEKSVQASNPWRELKWHANQVTPQFQLIKPSELQSVLDQRIASGKPIGNRAQKIQKKGSGKGHQPDIDPHKLRIESGIFMCGNDQLLPQIELGQVGPTANGIVLCDPAMSVPYLKGGKQLSAGGLAFIVLATSDSLPPTTLIAEKVRVPLICTANSEPLLVEGFLYQLGAQPVRRNIHQDRFKLESVPSCVGKFSIYRDQIDIPWEQFVQHPLKHLFSKIPVLQTCTDELCGGNCEMWHSCQNCTLADPILEIWNKQWMTYGFASVPPDRAETYSVCIRLPSSVQMQVQAYSGIAGVYVEPRSIDGRQPSEQFQVVWLPKVSNQELVLLRQTHPSVCGLARMGLKHGLRCKIEHAPTLHESVKPASSFLPQGRKRYYLVGPLPYGTVKASLTEALHTVGWKIRPLQTVATSKHIEGIMWKVQAVDEPPRTVIQLEHGEVLVTKLEDQHANPNIAVQVVGSDRTKQLCSSKSKGTDPLQQNDPWAAWSKPSGSSAAIPLSEAPLANLEKKVFESVMAKLPKESMEVDQDGVVDKRIQDLEQRVLSLQDGQQQLSHRIQEQGTSHGNQIQQLYVQSTRLEASVQDQSAALGQFQSQFRAQLEQQQGQLDSLFRQQMDRIEEILHQKKPRHHE